MRNLLLLSMLALPLVTWAQQFTWNTLPDNTYADSTHWPFVLGVASSEPGSDFVYLWVYAEPDSFTQISVALNWELATDSMFSSVVSSGTISADSSKSWTQLFKVTGLTADTYYWYRFNDGRGNSSVVGRTRTLPTNSNNIKLAVTSCSNIIAYYNTYARVADRNDLSLVIHLGDWAYDNLNQNRSDRYPDPSPTIRCGLEERRRRDYLHLLDPDLRRVRQMHPFVYLWDNHDIQKGEPDSVKNVCHRVFREFVGQPMVDSTDISKQYRKISLGTLVDLFIIDVQWTQDKRDSINGYETFLGAQQHTWLLNELQASTAKWKLIGNQKLLTPFSVQGLEALIPNGVNADEKSWDGFSEERTELIEFIRDNDIDNVMILSGDAHFTVLADVAVNPFDSLVYNGITGDGSVCVEFLPSGISSPNIDERGISYTLGPALVQIASDLNPHQFFTEFMDNGYGILSIVPDSITAEVFLLNAHNVNSNQYLANTSILIDGENHWKRYPTGVKDIAAPEIGILNVYPNPANNELNVEFISRYQLTGTVEVLGVNGKVVLSQSVDMSVGTNKSVLDVHRLSAGAYLVRIVAGDEQITYRFVKQ